MVTLAARWPGEMSPVLLTAPQLLSIAFRVPIMLHFGVLFHHHLKQNGSLLALLGASSMSQVP